MCLSQQPLTLSIESPAGSGLECLCLAAPGEGRGGGHQQAELHSFCSLVKCTADLQKNCQYRSQALAPEQDTAAWLCAQGENKGLLAQYIAAAQLSSDSI